MITTELKLAVQNPQITYCVEQKEDFIKITVPKEQDFSQIERIKICGLEGIADTEDLGYLVLPRANEGCSDYCICLFQKHTDDFEHVVGGLNMPIWGVKTKDKCFLAVVSGMPYVFKLRIVLKNGIYSLQPEFHLEGENPCEDLQIKIFFLQGENADYSGMARRYRQYQYDLGDMKPLSERIKTEEYLNYAVNSVMIRIRCGWKPAPNTIAHQTLENEPPMHVACDFDRVGDIIDELKRQGVDKAQICLVGWNHRGHDGRWPQPFPVEEDLGGEEKLRALIQKAKAAGYQIVCHTNHTDQYEISNLYDAEHTLRDKNGEPGTHAVWSGGQMYDLCPKVGFEQAADILPKVAELGFEGMHYIDVLGVVHPRICYHKDHLVNGSQSVEYAKKMCQVARDCFGGISSEGGYDFIAKYLDYALYICFTPEYKGVCDESIPFWQLVYHGTVLSNPYTATVNCTFKGEDEFLKFIEYGGKPTFYYYSAFMNNGQNWMGNLDCKCDDEEQLKDSVSRIKKAYEAYSSLSQLHTAFMEKHEKVAENVYEITYSNGKVLRVDYNTKSFVLKS